ncbi:MAG: hypothetical protein A3H79_02415, partial [Candidatus Levybacteria bacterium RIFCSPLOWO2_02_FULL_36_8b]
RGNLLIEQIASSFRIAELLAMTRRTVFEEIKKESSLIRILVIFLIIAVGIYLFQIAWQILGNFSDIIIILISAWLLSFILEPVVDKISSLTHLPRILSTTITYLLISAILAAGIFLFIPIVNSQIQSLTSITPKVLETAPKFIAGWSEQLTKYLNNSISVIASVAQFLFSVFIVLILSFYFIVDKERINKEFFDLTPKKWHKNLEFIENVINSTFASFLRVQVIFGIISGISTWIVLRVLGVDFAATAALLAGVFAIIPLVGPFLAIIPPVFVAFLVNPTIALFIFVIILVIQQIIFNVIGPKLLGKAFKLHPVVILISFLVGAKIAGSVGAIFAIPVIGIAAIVIRKLGHHFLISNKE